MSAASIKFTAVKPQDKTESTRTPKSRFDIAWHAIADRKQENSKTIKSFK